MSDITKRAMVKDQKAYDDAIRDGQDSLRELNIFGMGAAVARAYMALNVRACVQCEERPARKGKDTCSQCGRRKRLPAAGK